MKGFKKFFVLICALCLALPLFAACGMTEGGSAEGSSDIEVLDPQLGFLAEDEYDPDTFSLETAKPRQTLEVDTKYYLYLSFDVVSRRDNDGQSTFDAEITFTKLNVLDGTVDEAGTGVFEEMTFTDAQTGDEGKTTSLTFKIPPTSSQPRTVNMIISLKPQNAGESHIKLNFNYDAPNMKIQGQGSNGYTKKLTIEKVKIEKPVLEVLNDGVLSWKHVKNADYYMIFNALSPEEPLTTLDGEVIKVSGKDFSVGDTRMYNIGEHIFGFRRLQIRAYSESPNIIQSDLSEIVEFTW